MTKCLATFGVLALVIVPGWVARADDATPETRPTSAPTSSATPATTAPATRRATAPASKPVAERPRRKAIDGHAMLAKFVGSYDIKSKIRGGPDEPWVELAGTEVDQLTLGGKFLQSASVVALPDGTTIENITLTGFDPKTQQFEWVAISGGDDAMLKGTGVPTPDDDGIQLFSADGQFRFILKPDARGYTAQGFTKDPATGKSYQFADDRYERKPE